jgi:hypothetical protein
MPTISRLFRRALLAFALASGLWPGPGAWAAGAAAGPFAEVGVKFVESHCVSCHGKDKQKANLALHTVRDDLGLLRARKQWREVVRMVESGDMPPEDKPQPTNAERSAFLASVKAVFAAADHARPDPGRTTVRRLNRTEYNNTIRDLLHVEFKPADDFPSDDVGFGFDNIADVMSISPVLMERYLDAAERIAEDAIPLTAAHPPKRTMAGKFCEPASATVPQDRFRPINAARKEAILSGPLNTPVRITAGNEFWVRARLYAEGPKDAPVRVALLATGPKIENPSPAAEVSKLDGMTLGAVTPCVILKTEVINARDEEHAQVVEVKIKGVPGTERMALAAFKPPPGKPTPTLRVEFLETEGPLDVRTSSQKALMVFTSAKSEREQVFEVLTRFVARAWRRPGTPEEIGGLCAMVNYAVGHNEGWEGGLRRAITAVLASPKFIFRLEPDADPENPAPHPLDEFELATRLAYFLWSSGPDDRLMELAYEKKLSANLDGEVRRMLKDPRSEALVDNFAMQWLQLGRIATHSADAKVFARWDPKLAGEMIEETRRFCAEILRDDRSVLDLLDGDFTWVDRRLADLYGLKVPGGIGDGEWKRVLLAGTPRGGLLTQASVLTVTSNPTRTSPVKRGKWVLEQLLGNPPPPAPPNVPSLDDARRKELTASTFREKLEQHRSDPKCANCHAKMDAFGLTLENFDGIGQWRDRDESGGRVDASAKLGSGRKLNGVADLRAFLRERKDAFTRCLSEKLLIYALGRGLDYYDDPTLDRIQSALARDHYKFSTLILEIVKSDPFRLRRGKGQETLTATAATAGQ